MDGCDIDVGQFSRMKPAVKGRCDHNGGEFVEEFLCHGALAYDCNSGRATVIVYLGNLSFFKAQNRNLAFTADMHDIPFIVFV